MSGPFQKIRISDVSFLKSANACCEVVDVGSHLRGSLRESDGISLACFVLSSSFSAVGFIFNRALSGRDRKGIMAEEIRRYLADDHARLGALLEKASAEPGRIDLEAYAEFREGLLRHIRLEEKILLPAIQRLRGGQPHPVANRLRLDHGALAALLVPTPTPTILRAIRGILAAHNALEEGPDGIYEVTEEFEGAAAEALFDLLRTAPEVIVAPHNDDPTVLEATRRTLSRAGYNLDDYAESDG